MTSLSLTISAIVQLGLLGAIVTYSFRQIRKRGGHTAIVVTAYLTTLPIVSATIFICAGGFLEKVVSGDRMEDTGVVATAAMVLVTLVSGAAALVCLLRKIKGWTLVFVLQSVAALYLTLILTYVAMGKPFIAR